MATVGICIFGISGQNLNGEVQSVPDAVPVASEAITSSAVSQQSAGSIANPTGYFWNITVTGGNVWVRFGSNPTAAAGDDWLILAGQTRDFAGAMGQKVAVIDA